MRKAARRLCMSWLVGCSCLSLLTACDAVDVGRDPAVLFWSDQETGLDSWLQEDGRTQPRQETPARAQYAIAGAPGKKAGDDALKVAIGPGTECCPRMFFSRGTADVKAAEFRALVMIPKAEIPGPYLVFMKIRSKLAEDARELVDAWDVLVAPAPERDGHLRVGLYRHMFGIERAGETIAPVGGQTHYVSMGQWLDVRLRAEAAVDRAGRMALWVDGVLVAEASDQPTLPSPHMDFAVGLVAEFAEFTEAWFDDVFLRRVPE